MFNKLQLKEKLKLLMADGVHGISFTPNRKSIDICSVKLVDENIEFCEYETGTMYHVVLYNMERDGTIKNLDKFEAILAGPEVYLENIIKSDFYGFIIKKTKEDASEKFTSAVYTKLCELL